MTSYVAGFCFDKILQNVLLIFKNKPEWQKGKLNAIGGKIEENETPLQAMQREFKEETLCYVDAFDWKEFCILQGTDFKVHFFYAHTLYTDSVFQSLVHVQNVMSSPNDEHIFSMSVKSATNTSSGILPNLCWLIPMALNCLNGVETCKHFTVTEN